MRFRTVAAPLVAMSALLLAVPHVNATPAGPYGLLGVTAEIVMPRGEAPYVCLVNRRVPVPRLRPPVFRCPRLPVAGAIAPGPAWLTGYFRNGVFYVVARDAPRADREDLLPPPLFCCRSVRAQQVLESTDEFLHGQAANRATQPYVAEDEHSQPYVTFDVIAWTDQVAAFVASQPDGLVRPWAFLRPA